MSSPAVRILVIDDNTGGREMLRTLLEMEGYVVATAATGQDGLKQLAAVKPDVALIDISLPDIDGYEVARRIRADRDHADLLLIALTGHGLPEDSREAVAAGFDVYLVKPLDPRALGRLLAERGGRRELA